MNLILVAFLVGVGAAGALLRWSDWILLAVIGGLPVGVATGTVFAVGPDAESVTAGASVGVTVAAFLLVSLKLGQLVGHRLTSRERT